MEEEEMITSEEIRILKEELEKERLRLAACGVVALANTKQSAAQARLLHSDYMSASLGDVMSAVS